MQGLAMTLGQSFPRQKDVGRKSVRHNPFHQTGKHPFPQAAIVTTNSSLQPVNDLRTPILVEPGTRHASALSVISTAPKHQCQIKLDSSAGTILFLLSLFISEDKAS